MKYEIEVMRDLTDEFIERWFGDMARQTKETRQLMVVVDAERTNCPYHSMHPERDTAEAEAVRGCLNEVDISAQGDERQRILNTETGGVRQGDAFEEPIKSNG